MLSDKGKKESALATSVKEGTGSSLAYGFGDSSITPLTLALKGTSFHIGIINALVGILSPLAQLWGSRQAGKSKRAYVRKLSLLQVIFYLPLIAICLYAYKYGSSIWIIYAVIATYTILTVFSGALYPAWFSWMGYLVDEKERGKYFSRRGAIIGAVGLAATILGAFILDEFKTAALLMIGFGVLFLAAEIGRIMSYYYLGRQYEPKSSRHIEKRVTFLSFIKQRNNLSTFTISLTLFNFALMIASPFFAVYLLQSLKFSYVMYTLVIMSGTLFYLLFLPAVGRIADRYGSTNLIKISCILFALSPLLWLPFKSPWALIFIPQLVSGLANATLAIGMTNFTYEAIPKEERGDSIAYINILIGFGVLAGSLLGGILLSYLPNSTNIFFTVFVVSAAARGLVALMAIPRIKEEKKVKSLPPLSFNMLHPIRALHIDMGFLRQILK